uniref:putative pentatricopeptide repeat-containing protein At5g43820 n=1 Tax=Erigeron canadensis TaxID=72917 RepID=UPI001CB94756|nr:putative pentatricopeptide repeat-containing protein At5g43820 [Erigeron canadensis]
MMLVAKFRYNPFQILHSSSIIIFSLFSNTTKTTTPIPNPVRTATFGLYSTHTFINNNYNNEIIDKEQHVLDQLSVLLPIRHQNKHLIPKDKNDDFMLLSDEDKLRGIFIQKLRGKNAIKNALSAINVNLTCDLVNKVLNKRGCSCLDAESMVTFFEWAVETGTKNASFEENVDSYNLVLKSLGRRKFFEDMISVLSKMRGKGVDPDYETLFVVMDAYVKAGRVAKGLDMFKKLEEFFGMRSGNLECLKVVLRCLCRRGYVAKASSLLSRIKEKVGRFDGETYNIVICGWCKRGRVDEIERVLKEMVEDGFDPDGLTYSYLLEGLGRGGRVDDAVKIFENVKEEKMCVLDVGVYNAMIFNFISIGDIDECLRYYSRMLSDKCEPNEETYVSIIKAFLKARRVADAIEMFDEMLGKGIVPAIGTVTSFIETLCGYGPPHAAMMIYRKAKDAKCMVSVNAYKILLMRLSKFGKCGMLYELWDEMGQSGYVSDVEVYEHIINGLCNNGQLENAAVVMEDCLKKGFCPSSLICAKLNNKLMASNKVEMAYKLFLKIKRSRRDETAQKYWRAKGWHF